MVTVRFFFFLHQEARDLPHETGERILEFLDLRGVFGPMISLSPILFNLTLEKVIKSINNIRRGVQLNGKHEVLTYADDIAPICENMNDVEALYT